MIVLFPICAIAEDTGAAVIHAKGGVWINGSEAVDGASIFPGDLIETKPGFVANVDTQGSSVLVQSETMVKFKGNALELAYGTVSVGTSTSMKVEVNCLEVEPTTAERTEYDVTSGSTTVHVSAVKSDVKFAQTGVVKKVAKENESAQSAIVKQGEQAQRHDVRCAAGQQPPPAGNSFPIRWIEIGGGAAGAAALCLVFCKGSSQSNMSQSDP
jgi:hypothetical protein